MKIWLGMNTEPINHRNKTFSLLQKNHVSDAFLKRLSLATQFNLIGCYSAVFFSVLGWYLQLSFLWLLNLILAVLFTFLFFLKTLGYYSLYLFCFLILANLATFVLASYFGNEGGGYLYFFPIVLINFYFFHFTEKKRLVFSLSFSFLLLFLLQITEYSFFLIPKIPVQSIQVVFNMNLWVSLLFVLYWMNYLFKEN